MVSWSRIASPGPLSSPHMALDPRAGWSKLIPVVVMAETQEKEDRVEVYKVS